MFIVEELLDILHSGVPVCIMLYCIVLYCIVLYCIVTVLLLGRLYDI